ncbi:MAG: IS1380 family transposase [Bryobacteraceae bacterium]
MTECNQSSFKFEAHFSREVVARFDGGALTSDGGALLLREVDRRIHLMARLAECFEDHRNPLLVRHQVKEMVAQRVYALALGYEDLNDHDQLREDPLLAVLSGKKQAGEELLAGKSTLNRLELSVELPSRYKKIHCRQEAVDKLLVDLYLEAQDAAPELIVLDLDVTDLPLHGHQEGRFFHGYYDEYCYLPLYIFAGEHLLCARLRTADQDAAAGSTQEVERIVGQIRSKWADARIVVRADSGFCREELMAWCEAHGVGYVLGFARNERLRRMIAPQMEEAAQRQRATGKPARVFTEFEYQTTTGSWSKARRVVAKAEQIEGKENPRFVVTNLSAGQWPAQALYEELYCARGEMENRIKEQLSLFATRVSAETMQANQVRLNLAGCAYVLLHALRRLGLKGTGMEHAQAATIRLRLLKIGARIRITARRIWLSMASGFPLEAVFRQAWAQLRC